MKIVTYNIQYGLGADDKYDLHRISEEVRGADVIALQEVDRFWERSGSLDQPEKIASNLPNYYWVYGANFDVNAAFKNEKGVVVNRRRQFGTMLLSLTPIISSRNFPLPKYGAFEQHSIQQGCLEGVIDTPFGPIRFYSVHFSHLASETRLPQVQTLLDIHQRAYGEGGAWCGGHPEPDGGWLEGGEPPMGRTAIVLGDMNFDCFSPEYDLFCGPVSPEYGRLTHRTGFVDGWVAAGNNEQAGRTHPNNAQRIDHCFLTTDLSSRVKSARVDDSATGSDHWPLWIELDFEGDK